MIFYGTGAVSCHELKDGKLKAVAHEYRMLTAAGK